MQPSSSLARLERLPQIERARQLVLGNAPAGTPVPVEPYILQSWQRCLQRGHRPDQRVGFDAVSAAAMRRTRDASQALNRAAAPVIDRLAQAIAGSRYFAILTDAAGIVVDVKGAVDTHDHRATAIARIGVDLSEAAVGTTAIGAALTDLRTVWLHRGEHFFHDTGMYSCAGAPIFGADGRCVGMLDLTGIDVAERPELAHLAAASARSISNRMVQATPHALALWLNWPGCIGNHELDGLLCLDKDGIVTGTNQTARQILGLAATARYGTQAHASDFFATPWTQLFDAARRDSGPLDIPLWSGLRVQGQPVLAHPASAPGSAAGTGPVPLRDLELHLIRRAVQQARGNVAEAARMLGISRATVYRKLGERRSPSDNQ